APEEGLLERDPLRPPRAERPRAPEPGREAHEEHPAEDEEAELHAVEEIRGQRESDALQHEFLAAQAHEFGEAAWELRRRGALVSLARSAHGRGGGIAPLRREGVAMRTSAE